MSQPANPIRVLVVEDSLITRHLIVTALNRDPAISVVGTAGNGLAAIEAAQKHQPDLVTMDIEMPELDGIAALQQIRRNQAQLPVIMLSSLTQRGARETIRALTSGASDYLAKPKGMDNPEAAYAYLAAELIPKIKALCPRPGTLRVAQQEPMGLPTAPVQTAAPAAIAPTTATPQSKPAGKKTWPRVDAVCIAISTGGPMALVKLFEHWEQPLPVPLLIVQHMPPKFTALLAERLSTLGVTTVEEPYEGQVPLAGYAYIAPGGWHMEVQSVNARQRLHLSDAIPENSCRPAADVLFRSAAQVYGRHALALVMTGMGTDGLNGARSIAQVGGMVVAQDQASSAVWGMPGAVVNAGLADEVWRLDDIAKSIWQRTKRS
jgi:two-component system chemotaxis response regulator CheB